MDSSLYHALKCAKESGHMDFRDIYSGDVENIISALKMTSKIKKVTVSDYNFRSDTPDESNYRHIREYVRTNANLTYLKITSFDEPTDTPTDTPTDEPTDAPSWYFNDALQNLRKLSISRGMFEDDQFECLVKSVKYSNITSLSLSEIYWSIEHTVGIAELITGNTLTELRLCNLGINDDVQYIGEALYTNTSLEMLDLSHNTIGDSIKCVADALRTNKTLKRLYLNSCGVTASAYFVDSIKESSIECLGLKNINYTKILPRLFTLPLVSLNLRYTMVNELLNIPKMIAGSSISSLKLDLGDLTGGEIVKLCGGIADSSIVKLRLRSMNNLPLGSISEVLLRNKTITHLDLDMVACTKDELDAIAYALGLNKTLRHFITPFRLNQNNIACNALCSNNTLQSIDLTVHFSNENTYVISQMLKHNTALKKFTLYPDCNASIEHIADAMRINRSLLVLSIHGNITMSQILYLADALVTNTVIENVTFRNDHMYSLTIFEVLKRNARLKSRIRRIALMLVHARSVNAAGIFGVLPREIVLMIARQVWASRIDSSWLGIIKW